MSYRHVQEHKEIKIRNILIDRSWRYVKEVADFQIERILIQKRTDRGTINELKNFALEILIFFQNLMKSAIDFNDLDSLKLFVSAHNELFKGFHPSQDMENVDHIDLFLQKMSLDEAGKATLTAKRELQQIRENAENAISMRKKVVVFALSAWILRRLEADRDSEFLRNALLTLKGYGFGSSLDELTDVFLSSMGTDESGHLGWEWWELNTRKQGVTYRLDFSDFLQKTYVVGLLSIYQPGQALPVSRSLSGYATGGQSKIRQALHEIQTNYSEWEWTLPAGAIDKIPALLQALDGLELKQKETEELVLMAAPLSEEKVVSFKDNFQKGYGNFAGLFALCDREKIIKNKLDTVPSLKEIPAWGFNEVFDKEAFIKDAPSDYGHIAEQYGEAMARDENGSFLSAMADGLEKFPSEEVDLSRLPGLIKDAIQKLRERGIEKISVITSLDYSDLELQKATDEFLPSWHKDCPKDDNPGYIGILKLATERQVPIFRPTLRPEEKTLKGIVCVCSIPKLGHATYFSAAADTSERSHCRGKFFIKVIDLNADHGERNKLVAANPPWLATYPDKERYLKKRSILMIFERLQIDFRSGREAGYVIKVKRTDDKD